MGSEHGGPGTLCDTRLLIRGESGPLSSSAYHQGAAAYHHYKPAGASLCGGGGGGGGAEAAAAGMNDMAGTQSSSLQQHMSSMISGGRAPFTSGQWAELEHQALIFKYMMAGVNVPQDLLIPIRRSVAALINGMTASHHAANLRWGPIHRGVPSNADPEPGRCRRTDGKKWRCGRDVVPDQKYCERHMHRGRHRPRRHADGQTAAGGAAATATGTTTSASSSGAAGAAGMSTNVGPIRGGSSTPGTASSSHGSAAGSFSLSNLRAGGGGGPSSLSSVKSFSTVSSQHSGSPGSGGGSSPAASSQFGQLPSLTSSPSSHGAAAAAASNLSSKDYRYLGSMIKSEQGIGSEQMLSSETSGSTGGPHGGQDSQMLSNLSRLPSLNWHSSMTMSNKIRPAPAAPEPKVNNGSNLLHYHSPQMRGLLGQDFGLLPETASQVDVSGMSASQQQQQAAAYVSNAYGGGGGGGAESVSVGGHESEGQPLRHFFDDWPRSTRDQSAMTWGSGVDDSERSNSDNLTGHAPNNTQLSISIPITAPSSAALSAQHSSSPPADFRRDHAIRYGV